MSELNTPESIDDGMPEVDFDVEVLTTVQAPVDDTLTISGAAADAAATGEAITAAKEAVEEEIDAVADDLADLAGELFPVGSIVLTTSSTAPTFGAANWNWQEIMLPVTQGDLIDGARNYAAKTSGDTPGNIHFWLRIADSEG